MPDINRLIYNSETDDWFLEAMLHCLEESGLEPGEIDNLDEFIKEFIETAVLDALPKCSTGLLQELKSTAPDMLSDWHSHQSGFERRLRQVWGRALDLLTMLLVGAVEVGGDFAERFGTTASQEQDYGVAVLMGLHARACQVGFEILTLLESGYADGAHARWRTLHEIAVVAFFLKKHGNEVAERYRLHEAIESYRAACQYREYSKALGLKPINDREFAELKSAQESLVRRFGPSFKSDYGWASDALKNKKPTFADIAREVDLDYAGPYYRLASHNVHANPKGITVKLGLGLHPRHTNVLLAGPSNAGLADPGHGTAISIVQVTVALLTTRPNFERLVMLQALSHLRDEIGEAFFESHLCVEALSHPDRGNSAGDNS